MLLCFRTFFLISSEYPIRMIKLCPNVYGSCQDTVKLCNVFLTARLNERAGGGSFSALTHYWGIDSRP
jgi:hypothetical protein